MMRLYSADMIATPATALDIATSIKALAEDRFTWSVPEGWSEGRTTWSGVSVAALARAIEAAEPDRTRLLRNMTAELLAPVPPGPIEISVRSLRRGSRQSTIRADLVRDGETLVTATAMLAAPRREVVPPLVSSGAAIPPPEDVPALAPAPWWPDVLRRFEFRPAIGSPLRGAKDAVVAGWLRFAEPPAHSDAPVLLATLDSWGPAAWATVKTPYLTATTTSCSAIACDPRSVDLSKFLRFAGRKLFDHEGFQMESRELYDASGHLLATNQRTFVVLG